MRALRTALLSLLGLAACHPSAREENASAEKLQPAIVSPQPAPAQKAAASDPASIAPGASYDWVSDKAPDEVRLKAGPYDLLIRKRMVQDLIGPTVTISSGEQSVDLEQVEGWPGHSYPISLIELEKGAPAVLLQSYTGGAHCCNSIQLVGLFDGKLKTIDLGQWDGEPGDPPKDVSGDGRPDFVMYDNRFLYAFASYGDSFAPPQILNIVNGDYADVSARPEFRPLFAKAMKESGEVCRQGEHERNPNGACPTFVASAARIGQLDKAWAVMLKSYDPDSDWPLPDNCMVSTKDGNCPKDKVRFHSYPEALLGFLKDRGYIPQRWQPKPPAR